MKTILFIIGIICLAILLNGCAIAMIETVAINCFIEKVTFDCGTGK